MQTILCMILSLAPAANPDSDARAALALALAQQRGPPVGHGASTVPLTYGIASRTAASVGKPLVTFIGVAPRPVTGAIVCQASALDGYDDPCIVVSVPGRGWLDWRATLPATASDAEICRAIEGDGKTDLEAPSCRT